jgi:enoyl-CoA hydratase/carnithine racemase
MGFGPKTIMNRVDIVSAPLPTAVLRPHSTLCACYTAHRDFGGKVTLAIFRCRKITIVAVNGHAAGFGFSGLQLPCDFRFVWAGAKLALPFVRRGIAAECVSFSSLTVQYSE